MSAGEVTKRILRLREREGGKKEEGRKEEEGTEAPGPALLTCEDLPVGPVLDGHHSGDSAPGKQESKLCRCRLLRHQQSGNSADTQIMPEN